MAVFISRETDGVIEIEKQSAKDVGEIKHIVIHSPNYTRYFYNESMPLPSAEAVTNGRLIDADAIKYIDLNRDVKNDLKVFVAFKEDVDALPTIEAVQGWIPCSERLPNVGENVLFTTDIYGGYVAEGDRRADGKWWQYRWNSLLQNDDVIAWMPLPKPYREDGEEE